MLFSRIMKKQETLKSINQVVDITEDGERIRQEQLHGTAHIIHSLKLGDTVNQ